MDNAIAKNCSEHSDIFDCPGVLINYTEKFNEYGIIIHDGGTSICRISFCPWCGLKLPNSMRDMWLVEIEKLGIDPWVGNVPDIYKTKEWYSDLRNT